MAHTSEDYIEKFAMGTLSEAELAPIEEHLLICSECRDRLEVTERYAVAMRAAAARIRESETAE